MATSQIQPDSSGPALLSGAHTRTREVLDLDGVLELTHLLHELGWSSCCTAIVLEQRYAMTNAQDMTDVCRLTTEQGADFKAYLTELTNDWNCQEIQ